MHVVDDDVSLRAALVRLLQSDGISAKHHATSSDLYLALLADERGPRCVLLDVRLAGENGLSIQETLREHGEAVPIVFLTDDGTIPMTVRAMRGGAAEFLTTPVEDVMLLTAVRRALKQAAEAQAARRAIEELGSDTKR